MFLELNLTLNIEKILNSNANTIYGFQIRKISQGYKGPCSFYWPSCFRSEQKTKYNALKQIAVLYPGRCIFFMHEKGIKTSI